jgi:hypothetical protein
MSPADLPLASRMPARRLRRPSGLVCSLAAGAMAMLLVIPQPAKAEESPMLIIPADDGYGFGECLKSGSPCGLVVADSWCKAHGFAGSKAFGPAAPPAEAGDGPPDSFHVVCGGRLD